jgi:uncharacterized protein (UPF0297 family)
VGEAKGGSEMTFEDERTMMFRLDGCQDEIAKTFMKVYEALVEKGYDPVGQIVGYLLSGDPSYITSHDDARGAIRRLNRDELLEVLVKNYLAGIQKDDGSSVEGRG